ncbi:DUF4843 domain-containing protein [Pedobacter gandavensis]|uniref:DUF4843 domain-containing protein n=1 Tax=Pedobacter gandavensis TaxID=2679963 RepID=A0ABR6F1H7_9SPHI|nr:DUF4843 domain-containing protein [Pedobacter gandavensis]MBB2151383.1 DUF4843 domain-containing protein [Pedobacter gandavensis]
MKKITPIIMVLLMALILVSCEKGLMTYDNKDADVYFSDAGRTVPEVAFDSTYVSLSYSTAKDSTIKIVVAVSGSRVDHDRAYNLAINPLSTAIEGVHFEALPRSLMIRKNKLLDTIKLKLIRTAEMMTKSFFVKIDLMPSPDFSTKFNTRAIKGKSISTISTKILFDDLLKKPKLWADNRWGTFSRKKLLYVCDFLGITPQYMDGDMSNDEVVALPRLVQRHLDRLKLEGNPVYEEDGSLMAMGYLSL